MVIIIGKNSNLSKMLQKNIINSILISSQNILKELNQINFFQKKDITIIFNNFQVSTKLNDLSTPVEYINRSIVSTSVVLEYIKKNKLTIAKIIYTSSSSVYGNNILCSENDAVQPLNLHASLKVANENLIKKFCLDNTIDYTIARIFNMYGKDDNFSIISKIIDAYTKNKILMVINAGDGIRDFINIEDVVYIYKQILIKRDIALLNIGTGKGLSIHSILSDLKDKNFIIQTDTIQREELKTSTANISKLKDIIGEYNFQNVKNYIEERLKEKGDG